VIGCDGDADVKSFFVTLLCGLVLSPSMPAARTFQLTSGSVEVTGFSVERGRYYGLLVSAPDLAAFQEGDAVSVEFTSPDGRTLQKTLHAGDADLYMTVRPEKSGRAQLKLAATGFAGGRAVRLETELTPMKVHNTPGAQLATGMHTTWETAEQIELGATVYASADDRAYIPALSNPRETFEQMLTGIHWYRFDYRGPGEKLVHINVDILDRDVPVDVALFTIRNGKPVEYTRGRERFEPEKSTILHGLYKFIPRALEPGTYYLRVMGNHPAYQVLTELYPVPPYKDPQQAVRVAMDYIVRKGDSWHANIPRRGVVALRTTNPVQETKLCIACHPTHFSTRGEMIAVENGYPVRARTSLQFLIERLYNNPRPIYGRTDASWARMIHAPGNVLSRLAYIVNKFEREISGERREELYRGIAEFLKMYWPGMAAPEMESNGNLPRVSGFEVAHHSGLLFEDLYERTGKPEYAALRRQTEQVVLNGEPVDMLDLAWQTVALADFGLQKYRDRIQQNVEKIFHYQKKDGSWAMPFGMEVIEYDFRVHQIKRRKIPPRPGEDGPLASEFQTYHTIYALARAGVTLDDPRLKKAVEFCLSRQTASGAWQGSPEYKNFDTPFRDTQYAIMALSTLFPGPKGRHGAKGWNAGFPPPPTSWDHSDILATLEALDQHWDQPAEATVKQIRRDLDSSHVLVRRQAAVALGRFADAGSIDRLAACLGDRSKLVQRAAAWALRQIASRKPDSRAQSIAVIGRALESPDSRTRWGATRIFNQHFKYISEEWSLGRKLIHLARNESVPAIQMQAIQGLYQWWFWDRSTGHKGDIELALIAGLGRKLHPWVRRNFIEAYYNVLDDNLRYLYGSWIVRVKRDIDRTAIKAGHHQSVRAQAARFQAAMLSGNELMRDGLLRALHTHVLREGLGDVSPLASAPLPETIAGPWVNGYKWFAVFDPLIAGTGTRAKTGNDSDPPTFYKDSAPLMNEALLSALSGDPPRLALETMRALRFLKPFPFNPALADRVLALTASAPASMRKEVAEGARALLPEAASINSPLVAARLSAMVRDGDPLSIETAAAILSSPKQTKLASNPDVQDALRARLGAANPADPAFPHLVTILAAISGLHRDAQLVSHTAAGLLSSDPRSRQAVLRFILDDPTTLKLAGVSEVFERYRTTSPPKIISEAVALLGRLDYRSGRYGPAMHEIRSLLVMGMDHADPAVRATSLTAVRTIEPLQDDPEIQSRLARLLQDKNVEVRNSAVAFNASLEARGGRQGFDAKQLLDYEFFKVYVQPILTKKGPDGFACVNCHATHTIFKLIEPDEYGVLTEEQIRRNYASAVGNVVNISDPENSLILNKPISREDAAGIGNSQRFSHGGDVRWPEGKRSVEYRTILRWIRGERLGAAGAPSSE
jgi:hypothetical protein